MTSTDIFKILQQYVPTGTDIIHTSNLHAIAMDIAEKVNSETNASYDKGVIHGLASAALINNNHKFN